MNIEQQLQKLKEKEKELRKKQKELLKKEKEKRAKKLLKYADILDDEFFEVLDEKMKLIGSEVKVMNFFSNDSSKNSEKLTKKALRNFIKRVVKEGMFKSDDFKD